jgi:eukaryotic-like serine/threonine-protein kinase
VSVDPSVASADMIGGFRYIRTLHPGATSVVMEVLQESTARRFAMKQLLISRAGDATERKMFAFEAKLGMQLRHPNLIQVHQYVPNSVQPYFVMDFFPANHLRLPIAIPGKYAIPKHQLHRIIEQAASALAYMHDKGWVHRDVKPENILYNKAGEVRVIDYALAMRPFSAIRRLLGGKPKRQGTPSYMSPEQIRCEPPAPSADIYSFGITCYELACGRQPFRANSTSDLLNKHLNERPSPITAFNKAITPEYAELMAQMLQKRPANRVPSLHDFLARFSRIRIYQDDPDPQADRNAFAL